MDYLIIRNDSGIIWKVSNRSLKPFGNDYMNERSSITEGDNTKIDDDIGKIIERSEDYDMILNIKNDDTYFFGFQIKEKDNQYERIREPTVSLFRLTPLSMEKYLPIVNILITMLYSNIF
ncbi:hypothetical protein GJ496_006783 [Pomphorhynchus laevis]|nr:hypothetical protein GJ496_006783 [Pomphorhynchus laevis]